MIQNWKEKYFHDLSLKRNNPQTSPKIYWSIIRSCCNGGKITIIPPLSVNGKKPIFLTNVFHLNVILYQMPVSYQQIKNVLRKKICTR